MNLQDVLQALYDAGIQTGVRDEWDQGWQVRMDDVMAPLVPDLARAAQWFHDQALSRYPESEYSINSTAISEAPLARAEPDLSQVLSLLYNSIDRVEISSMPGKGWEVTFNSTVKRVASLVEAVAWLMKCKPSDEAQWVVLSSGRSYRAS